MIGTKKYNGRSCKWERKKKIGDSSIIKKIIERFYFNKEII
jgi:hypothetical protein